VTARGVGHQPAVSVRGVSAQTTWGATVRALVHLASSPPIPGPSHATTSDKQPKAHGDHDLRLEYNGTLKGSKDMVGSHPRRDGVVPPILWKIIIPAASGGTVYLLTSLTHQPQEWALMLSAFIGGVTLVVQFLVDFDRSLRDVEKRLAAHTTTMDDTVRVSFEKINTATATYSTIDASPVGPHLKRLVEDVTGLKDSFPRVALRLAQSEIERAARLIRELREGQTTYDGEDQDWLLTLVREAMTTIDATSTAAVDGGTKNFEDGFWASNLGQRYVWEQHGATERNVVIRRLFILSSPELAKDDKFLNLCRMQAEARIRVRILNSSEIPKRISGSQFDFILFDALMSYELILATRFEGDMPRVERTELIARPHHVQSRRALFEELWELGHTLD
jgi:hypothetical protein